MIQAPPFNPLPLLSVKPGLDSSLASIGHDLEDYFSASASNRPALENALRELHRIGGVLQMLSLRGVAVFCGELEKLLQEMGSPQEVTAMRCDVVRRALFSLTHYLDGLAGGASNAALRLFNEYQEMLQARGLEMAFESDLFFPELQVELPADVLQQAAAGELLPQLKAARAQYQLALLKWLKQDHPAVALAAMRAATGRVLQALPQDGSRAFWWVAGGLIECLQRDGVPPELNAKKLLGRIDLQLKALIDGGQIDSEAILSEMLYVLVHSHSVSEEVERIKEVYALEAYLLEEVPLPPSAISALLDGMRAELNVADETWERCVADDQLACERFVQLAEHLLELAEQLDRNTLQFLCKQIHTTAQHADEPERAQRIALDMAMALLLLSSGIEHYQHLGSGFHEQARIISARLQAALMRMPGDQGKLDNLISLYCQMEQREVMSPLAQEMQSNLQHIEQSLNAFFGDSSKRNELAQTGRLLAQVQGGLHILSLREAEQLLTGLRQAVERYSNGRNPAGEEMRAVAAAVSALEKCISDLALGQKPELAPFASIQQEIGEFLSGEEAPAPEVKAEPVSEGVAIRAGGEDEELLEVFLEEGREVMETLRSNLETSRLHMDSRDPLVIMRRSFHTLKGSSRMVGLTEFGEVAWAVERAMNRWLQDNKPATPELLDMIGDAEVLFQHWLEMLSSNRLDAKINTGPLLEIANCFEKGIEVLPSAAKQEKAAVPTPAPAAEAPPETVVIGNVSLSPMLFSIATEEAANHVRSLQKHLAMLKESEPFTVHYDFMRAAHTLAGVNRTMGFVQVAELAYALELWLEERTDKHIVRDTAQLALVEQTVARLDEMCAQVRDKQEPGAQPELIAQLQACKDAYTLAGAVEETVAVETPAAIAAEPEDISSPALEQVEAENTGQAPQAASAAMVASQEAAAPAAEIAAEPEPLAELVHEHKERSVHDEVDEQLLPIFLEEAHELYPQIASILRTWREHQDEIKHGRMLQRSLHTLKGSARMAGAMRLGELTHRVEGRIETAIAQEHYDQALWDELDNYLDRVSNAIDQLQHPAEPESEAPAAVQSQAAPAMVQPVLEVGAERAMLAAMLRVRSDTVDRLVNEAGEVSVARSRVETELREFKTGVQELTDSVNRLRRQLREIEIQAEGQMQARVAISGDSADKFDPLEFDRFTRFQELTRFMNESVHDVQTIQQTLLKNLAETEAALTAQSHRNRELQQGLMAIRMVPFSSIGERLYRIVRQTAKELGKRANLELSGTEVELDRSVLEKMTAPFEHLLRNAIAHGLEPPEQRQAADKPPIGEIRLSLHQESNEVVFEFSDDGAGLDMQRLRQKALEQGLIQPDEEASDEQAMQLIFMPGLSTAQEVTEISGRGVGLDVVRSEISALGGRLDVASTPGKGMRFTIHLPLTLAVTKVLMVRANQVQYALPATMVEQVQQVKPAALEQIYKERQVVWQDKTYPLFNLTRLLGNDEAELVSRPHNHLLLLRSGDHRICLHIDELIGNQEVVVKNIGPQLARLPGIAGATVAGNGTVILIINPIAFSQRMSVARKAKKIAVAEAVRAVPLVMVVDDSLTVRKITGRLLTRAGYQMVTAKDGVDALEQLTELTPDLMLLDVEMPRMDGFELAKRLRQDSKTKMMPIIMITSRTAEKHRNYALEIGVNEYLGKPYQEEELLAQLARYAPLAG